MVHLTGLAVLDLSYNNITGPLPAFIGNFTSLRTLDLAFNHIITGGVPREIAGISSLIKVFIDYIRDHKLPDDKVEAEQITRRSKNYVLVGDRLYRRGASSSVLLKCITPEEGQQILEEFHSGCCGNHAASRTLVGKAFRSGYYWPTSLKDAKELVWHCKANQFFAKQAHVPAHNIICIPPSWPFHCGGLTWLDLSNVRRVVSSTSMCP
jgi:hypothetical protein